MKTTVMNPVKAFTLVALGLAIAAMGIYVANADDAPGAARLGMSLMVAGVVLGVRAARNRVPRWAARTALAVGVVVAAFAAFLTHQAIVTAALFPQSQEVPSVVGSAPSPQYAAAIERARQLVRAAIVEQNLPGVSVAAGAGGTVVWAEGFGWRDVLTQAPVTPDTRFNIGTAASAVSAAVAPLGLTNTGAEPAEEWSPRHLGEPGDDFPPFTLIRHVIFRPIGLAPDHPCRAIARRSTSRDPTTIHSVDDARCTCATWPVAPTGWRSIPRRPISCASRWRRPGSVNGELAGGMVMSLMTGRDSGIVIAVTSNIAHANTSSLALRAGDAFAKQTR